MNDLDNISSLIGLTLRELRLKAGFKSYEQFAHHHKLSRIQYWKMENGNNFTLKSLLNLLNIHQIDARSFLLMVEKNNSIKQNNSGPATRIQKLIDYSELSKKEFSIKIGYKTLTALNKVLFKNQKIPATMCKKIEEAFPEVNIMWLLNEEGDMLKARETIQ